MSCKNDLTKKDTRRKTPSSDEELSSKNKSNRLGYGRVNGRTTSSSNIRATKSRRFSKSTAKRKSKSAFKFDGSEELSSISRSSSIIKVSKTVPKGKKIRKNNKYSSSEDNDSIASNDSDSTSEYEEPKRKSSSLQQRNKKINNGKTNPATKLDNTTKRKRKWDSSAASEVQSTSTVVKNKEAILFDRTDSVASASSTFETKIDEKHSQSPIDLASKNKQIKKKWRNSDSSELSENENNSSDESKADNSKYNTTKNKSRKRCSRNFFRRQPGRLYQQNSSEDDEHDEICSSSSMSPQPLGDRMPMKTLLQQEPETINMGGEPDTINMGGEPDDDNPSVLMAQNVFSPKAPLAPPANVEPNAEDDENTGEHIVSNNLDDFNLSIHSHVSPDLSPQQFLNPMLKSFENVSLRKSFDGSLNLQNQHIDNIDDMSCISTQRSQSFNVGQMYENYIFSTSNNTNLPVQESYINSVKNIEHSSHINSFQSYYMQQEPCLINENQSDELQQSISLKTAEQSLDNISMLYLIFNT